ncbi:cell division control protein 6 homolog [Culicoides brevitarsis]|uniref:cell division control protein 6 homolog n=1 Tax=Culicoides brevitarsis TaxID=469753 RepID=UPI00307B34B9
MPRLTRRASQNVCYKENIDTNIVEIEKPKRISTRKRQSPQKLIEEESPTKTRKKSPVAEPDSPGVSAQFSASLHLNEKKDDVSPQKKPKEKTKYQNARRALTNNENYNLPGRENELKRLQSLIDSHLDAEKSGSLYISGQPGTGKTASLMKIMNNDNYKKRIKIVYINCTSMSSAGSIYKRISTELALKPKGTTEKDHLKAIEDFLVSRHKMVMLVLDEIDQLSTNKQTVLYKIFEWPSWEKSKVILVGIANALDLTDRLLSRLQAKCELKPELIHFTPYSKAQIVDIFKSRLEEGGVLDLFPATTLQLLAAKVASVSGDIRRALDIGRRVVEIAEQRNKVLDIHEISSMIDGTKTENPSNEAEKKPEAAPVQIKEVLSVLNNVYSTAQSLTNDEDDAFPLQQKLLICALLLIIKHDKNKDITLGRLHDVYKRVCNKRNLLALDQTEFSSLCSLVEVRGIIRVLKKKESRLNRVTLQWDEQEVNAALKDKQLIATILDDKSCLSR